MPTINIYSDESCLGNQHTDRARPGGAGALMESWRPGVGWYRRDLWISEPDTTNNRMAIQSAIESLSALKGASPVVFTSDSRYLVDGMSTWVPSWKARDWTRKAGLIENLDLWKELELEASRHQIAWRWVRGHDGHPQNEYANFLATRAAAQQTTSEGAIESQFVEWLNKERERGRYLDVFEFAPPPGL